MHNCTIANETQNQKHLNTTSVVCTDVTDSVVNNTLRCLSIIVSDVHHPLYTDIFRKGHVSKINKPKNWSK